MKNSFITLILLFNVFFAFGQGEILKNRFNHTISIGTTNSVIINSFEGINDWEGYSKRQVALDYELGYLFSFRVSRKIEIKAGLNLLSWVKNSFQYYGYNKVFSISNPNIPILIEFHKLNNSDFFISTGFKFSYSDNSKSLTHYAGENLSPEAIIEQSTTSGINPIISFGIGKTKMICDKYRLEWLLSYNQGTNPLRSYRFVRYDPYIESTLNANNSHLSFTLRYYFKKYRQNE